MKGKRRGFRLFPGRLPQSWMTISHGAQGMAFHWWRVFEDEVVAIPAARIAAAMGLQPEARRHVGRWLREMLDSGALHHVGDGGLRMSLPIPGDAGQTMDERYPDAAQTPGEHYSDATRTLGERWSYAGRTLAERWSEDKPAESLRAKITNGPIQTDRQTDGIRARTPARENPHPLRLRPMLEECVRTEFGKRNVPSQKASASQWAQACERVQEALDLTPAPFAGAQEACEALAKTAVADALKPGGKLGFALQQAAFVEPAKAEPTRASLLPTPRVWGET